MLVVTEEMCREIVGHSDAFDAVEKVFAAMARGEARNFHVVREDLDYKDALYGFKSGFDKVGKSLGVKSGGYWPNNAASGLTNHQSTIFLFDPDTGMLQALVGGNYLTAVRTAAASSVSIAHLARRDAETIGMIGAGHQSTFQLHAALEKGNFKQVVGWNLSRERLDKLAEVAGLFGLPFEAVERDELAARSDVIITITSAHEPLIMREWIKPGAHIACMGTDTKGKQEVDPELVASSTLFTDEIAQSITIGEAQHAFASGRISETDITPLGDVINGAHKGRTSCDQITLFDGTGVGLQDLAVAGIAAALAKRSSKAIEINL